jgi:hypothetical protein
MPKLRIYEARKGIKRKGALSYEQVFVKTTGPRYAWPQKLT